MYSHVLQILFFRDKWYQQTPAPCQDINIKLLIQACLCWSRVQRFRNDTRGGEQNYRCWLQCCPQQRSWGVYLFARNSSIITKKKLQDDIELFKLHPFAYLKVISDFAWKHAKQQPFFKPKEAEIKATDSTLRLFSVLLLFVCFSHFSKNTCHTPSCCPERATISYILLWKSFSHKIHFRIPIEKDPACSSVHY